MAADLIIKASSIITMEVAQPRVEAVAIDTSTGTITALGSLSEMQAAAPQASVTDLGSSVLMPGFIDPHNHPLLSGIVTQDPVHWIAPYVGYPSYDDVKKLWRELDSSTPAGQPLLFCGLDRLLQGAPELTNTDLDEFFPSRPVLVLDNSGHEAYFNSAVFKTNGWTDSKPPADPVGSRFGRNADGTSNGRAYETAAELMAAQRILADVVPHPLLSTAGWLKMMSDNGITATSEHTFKSPMLKAYEVCTTAPGAPMRIGLYHMSIEHDCGEQITSTAPAAMLWKQGIKLWADGSPWVGTIASSFPYLDTPVVRDAQIPLGPSGETMMNYTRTELDAVLAKYAPSGFQFAFHVNGDVGLDIVLDAYEQALVDNGLMGTDHRWRVEHVGGCRGDQFNRAASMGVTISMLPAQFIYWGDLLDGQMFPTEIGSQWMRAGDAFRSGATVSFHNDGLVSPPIPLLNVQSMVTRRTPSGAVHGAEQQVSLDDAFKAHTINAARQLGRDHDLGSLAVGKLADLVQLSTDPYAADVSQLTEQVKVEATWVNGAKVDTDAFVAYIKSVDPTEHKDLTAAAMSHRC